MARRTTNPPSPQMPKLTLPDLRNGVARLRRRIAEVDSLDPTTLEKYAPEVDALQSKIDDALSQVFGSGTEKYDRYHRFIDWGRNVPPMGLEMSLQEYRDDVAKGKKEVLIMLAAAIESLEEEMAEHTDVAPARLNSGNTVFIGHGGSPLWRELKDFLKDRLNLTVDEFSNVPTAGVATVDRLTEMLERAAFAFLVLTGEDEQPDGKKRARENAVHEAGLFQGRLGFKRAIILLEDGCEEFSNIRGLGQIRFPKGNIRTIFEEIRRVLEREKLIRH